MRLMVLNRMILFPLFASVLTASCASGTVKTTGLVLAEDGQSTYSIYCDPGAPGSVKNAATEVQRVIKISAGVAIPIVKEAKEPMICMGDNAVSRKAGLSSERIPDEGFRIVTEGSNIYIIGQDWGDGRKKWADCESNGTLFGAYDFLERVVGVRWLMPGEWGEDIPDHRDGLNVPVLDISDSPSATSRGIGDIPGGNPNDRAGQWNRRNKIGTSMRPEYGHSFDHFPGTEVLLAHPEYMPMRQDGTREKPLGTRKMDKAGIDEHKLCLSNPGLVRAFSESVLEYIAKDPLRQCTGIGPSDGGEWCVCPECMKYRITDTGGQWGTFGPYRYSITPLVLKFYNEVGRAVSVKYPDHFVGGWVYSQYLFPPYESMKVEPNVHLQIGSTDDYGYKLYRPDRLERVQRLIREWAKIAPRLGWTDYSLWMRNPFGAPLPPGLPIMKTIYPAFGKSLKSIMAVGHPWGYGGANNYLAAKLMWNSSADVDALYREYLERAYGPAAPSVDAIYSLVEESLKKYIIGEKQTDHEIWYDSAKKVYAPIYEEMERLYVQALSQARTEAQRKRLEMFGENLVVFNWNMRNAGLIRENKESILYRTDGDFERFMADRKDSMAIRGDFSIYEKQNWQIVLWSPERRGLNVKPLAGVAAPDIDGKAGEPAWASAAVACDFRANALRRGPAKQQTTVKVTYDADNLYVAFSCEDEATSKLRANCPTRDNGTLFVDDYVGVLLKSAEGKLAQVAVNSKGVVYTTPGNASVKAAAVVGERNWTAEMAVPFRALGISAPAEGTAVQGNFVRGRRGTGYEMSAWSRVEERLDDERAFGELRFGMK